MSVEAASTYVTTAIKNVNKKETQFRKKMCIAGFFLPPIVGVGELILATKESVKHKHNNEITCLNLSTLQTQEIMVMKILVLLKKFIKTHDESLLLKYTHKEHLSHLKKIAHRHDFESPLAQEYKSCCDENLLTIENQALEIEKIRRMKIPSLIEKINMLKLKTEKYERRKKENINEIEAERHKFYSMSTSVDKKKFEIQNVLLHLEEETKGVAANKTFSKSPSSYSVSTNKSRTKILGSDYEIDLSYATDMAESDAQEINSMMLRIEKRRIRGIKREKKTRKQLRHQLKRYEQYVTSANRKFEAYIDLQELRIVKLDLKIKLLVTRAKMFANAYWELLRKRSTKEKIHHGVACLTVIGAYGAGIYQLSQQAERKKDVFEEFEIREDVETPVCDNPAEPETNPTV